MIDYYGRVLNSIRELPGVASVAAVTVLPMSTIGSDFYRPYWLEGARPDGNAVPQANVRMATPGYFATLGLPLVSGREFSAQDTVDAPRVIIINESLARSAWKGQDPVGRTLDPRLPGRSVLRARSSASSAMRGTTARAAIRRRRSSSRTRRTPIWS